jgi:hypothetical protein
VALTSLIGVASLAGCTGGSSLFGSVDNTTPEPQPKAVAEAPVAKVSINNIVGPPDALGKQLHAQFASALEQQRIAVVQKGDSANFFLRPYILAAKEKHGTKISYVMDVSDPTGKRVNRFAGEELVPGSPSADPWAAITPAVAQAIAAKATGTFAAWLPNAQTTSVALAGPPPSSAGAPKKGEATARAAPKKKAAMQPSSQTTGSITKDSTLTALVPAVKGAPGDGSTSLAAAIQRELRTKGVALADRPTPASYRVEGAVTLGASREGKQPIQIEWVVKDPHGKKLGTVSQKNDIPEGSLDGSWGRVADQAASAAVQGILKLLPSSAEAVN